MNSLRGHLLLWVLVPMSLVLALTVGLSRRDAMNTARAVEDARLLASAQVMADQVRWEGNVLVASTPPSALGMFASGARDRVYFQVRAQDGRLLAGWTDLDAAAPRAGAVPVYADARFRGDPVRVVSVRRMLNAPSGAVAVRVSVAETRGAYDALAWSLWRPALERELALLVLALVWMVAGLTRELRPLLRLHADLLARADDDLAPLRATALPRELRSVVETLNQYAARLTRNVVLQRRFIADAAHQLRTPIALLSLQLHDCAGRPADPDMRETLHAMERGVRHMGRLSAQLLSLSLTESRRAQPQPPVPVSLRAQAEEVLEELALLAMQRGVEPGLESGDAVAVLADPALVHALMFNLLDNALRYTPRGGRVWLALQALGEGAELCVCDTGPGIPAELRERVFERFFRVDEASPGGSGLGLAIVREAAAACGAVVRLEARAGGGLCARVTFAAALGPDAFAPVQDAGASPRARSHR